jgi:ABC-type lipoprotein release transport system permease subunit
MLVQVQLPRLNDRGESMANVAVRGVLENAFDVHRNVRIADGRNFASGAREIIVGKSAAQQFAGLKLGDTVQLGYGGDRDYVIVGHFDADGGPLESEIWGYLPSLMNAYNRELYSSANLRLVEGADARAVKEQIAGPAIQLLGQTESEYWRGQTKSIGTYLLVAYILAAVMCIAAVSSLAITMFSAVAGRTREIAMLRTIGFSPRQILIGFVLESVLLCLIGGAVGLVGCQAWLLLFGSTKDMYGAETFTTLAFEIRLNHWTVIGALVAVVVVGVIGSLPPAWRAARVQVISALRQA